MDSDSSAPDNAFRQPSDAGLETAPASTGNNGPSGNTGKGFSLKRIGVVVTPLALLVAGVLLGKYWAESSAERQSSLDSVERKIGIATPIQNRLADRYDDADGDLVADTPKNPKELLDPEVLTFSYIAGEHAEEEGKDWKKWCDDLAKATGKQVKYLPFTKTDDQLKAIREGRLHIAGLNTGSVPAAVDECGFVPLCTLGRDDGSFGYSMLLIVPAKSPIKDPKELAGHTITFKDPNSNSGYKAPTVTLLNQFGLRPTRDYDWVFAYEHETAISMTAKGECAAAAVAGDRLANAIQNGDIKESDVRVIFTSPSFPPAAIGCIYNLKPELVAKIKSALTQCNWDKAGLTSRLGGGGATRFVPINYRDAFATVRQIDDTMGVRHHME
jgi:phosphonate transport system substrate-binding protein